MYFYLEMLMNILHYQLILMQLQVVNPVVVETDILILLTVVVATDPDVVASSSSSDVVATDK